MLIDRPSIVEGSSIQNATVASGTSLPSLPSTGELFYNTSLTELQVYNGSLWASLTNASAFLAHVADQTTHLTPAQNTLLDGLVSTLTSAEVNYLDGVTSPIQTQLNNIVGVNNTQNTTLGDLQNQITTNLSNNTTALSTHMGDMSVHLTPNQNTFLDALNLPTITGADVNSIPALTSTVNTHNADMTLHMTPAQNTLIDGINTGTIGASDINRLNGLDGFLGMSLASYLGAQNTAKLARDGSQSMTGNLGMGGFRISALGDPVNATDAATKSYVDSLQQGLAWKDSAKVATTANIALTGLQTVDGVVLVAGDRVVVKNQTNFAENGIYVAAAGAWTRSLDANSGKELDGLAIFVRDGTVHQDTAWVQINPLNTFPGDSVVFSQFAAAGGATQGPGILIAGSTISVRNGNGLTFSGQNLMLNVTSQFALGSTLDLATVANAGGGALLKFSRDTYGRVTGTSAVTTADITGLVDSTYVNVTGDTMTGTLNGTTFAASTSLTSSGTLSVTGTSSLGNVTSIGSIRTGTSGAGYTNIVSGSSYPGYMEFATSDSVRRGYIGWGDSSNRLQLASENGWTWNFTSTPSAGGNPMLHTGNYNSYAPTLTGGNASGTWGINITGSAGSVTWPNVSGKPVRTNWNSDGTSYSTVVGQLGWKNYGNNHTIFDASNGTAPDGTGINNTTPTVAWASTYPTLMGWNGNSTYGVRVNVSDKSDNSTLLQGYAPAVGASGNSVVLRDGSGYINNSYFNSTDNSQSSGVSGIMVKAGDNYLRTGTAAAVASFISGQSMNISGNATTSSKASTLAQGGGGGTGMTFNWSGQGGQPAWLWGSNDGSNIYVWNPSNFSVNYANSAGTAGNVSNISNAVGNSYSWTSTNSFISSSNTGIGSASGTLMPQATGAGTAATISFHRPGAYGLNMGLDNDNVFRIGGWSAAANRLQLDMSGNLTVAGNSTAYSDIRLKSNIEKITGALAKVEQLNGVTFNLVGMPESRRNTGLIAQDVLKVLPEAVHEHSDEMKTLSVAYGNIVGLLVEAIKELRAEVSELKAKQCQCHQECTGCNCCQK